MVYSGEKFKYFCNECGNIWFNNTMFEDLCQNTLCESEHIYCIEITEEDKKKHLKYIKKLEKLKEQIPVYEMQIKEMPWIK